MGRLIFLGPSLDLETARGILTDAIYLPPLRQADLLSAVHRYQPSSIGIIDGYFLQDLSVWHKEILYALQRGIAVYGSSSMGALRAAEMAPYGMQGVGNIYKAYAEGTLLDDDEVALAHAPEDLGYAKLSEPMVNVRATLQAGLARRVISASVHDRAVQLAKDIYFVERSAVRLSQAWSDAGLPAQAVRTLDELFRLHYVDVKRHDAITLLQTMAEAKTRVPVPCTDLPRTDTVFFDTLKHRDRRTSGATGDASNDGIELAKVYRFAAIHSPDFQSLQFQALNRTLTALFAANLGIAAGPEQASEEARRFRASKGLTADEAFLVWLRENDLTEDDFSKLISERATCRLVQQWWISVAGQPGTVAKTVLDELRLNGSYASVAREAAELEDRTTDVRIPDVDSWTPAEMTLLLRQHAQRTGFRLYIPVQQWARETSYFSLSDMLTDLYRSKVGHSLSNSAPMI